jgi:hypothetical protein
MCIQGSLLLCLFLDFVHRARRSKLLEKARERRKLIKARWSLPGLLLLGWASPAAAQPTARMALTWSGPPGCPTTENVQARVDALLGGEASASSVADVRASGQVERVDSGFRLLLSMGVGSTPSSRVIEARTCEELAGAAAIAIALLARSTLDGGSASSSSGDGTSGAAPSGAASDGRPKAPKEVAPEPDRSAPNDKENSAASSPPARVQLVIDAPVGVAGWSSLPSAGLGLGAAVGLRWKALRAVVAAELWQPQTAENSGFATRYTLQSGRLQACLSQTVYGLELAPCVGAGLQRLSAVGLQSEVFSAASRNAVWVSGVGGLFASLPTPGFTHLRFFGEAMVVVSPVRPRFVIDQLGPVHEPALAAPRLDLGCEWIF